MPRRKTHIQIDGNTRKKIKAGLIIKKLTNHILKDNYIYDKDGNITGRVELLTPSQVRAAEVLLKKVLPDLSNVEMQAEVSTRPILIDLSGGKLKQAMAGDNEGDTDE